MNQKLKQGSVALILLIISTASLAQKKSALLPLTADSLATGNYKDVFKSFFQLALNRFTSDKKEIEFTSNPFALMAKINPDLLIDTNYVKYNHLRDFNFSFTGKLDSAYRFNGFSSGIKYALVNKRDETISDAFIKSAREANREIEILNDELNLFIGTINIDSPKRKLYTAQARKMFRGKANFSELDTSFQRVVKELATKLNTTNLLRNIDEDSKLNIHTFSQKTYDSLKTLFHKKPLLTIGLTDTTYKNQFFFSNIVFSTQFLQGIFDPNRPLVAEIDVRGELHFLDDTLKSGRDLQRSVFHFEPGLNLVFTAKDTKYSWAEFKLTGSYSHVFNGLYPGEKKNNLTLNGTFRIRIINDVWIPLEIKYDPKSGNVFGFLNVRANFTGLSTFVKSLAN